MNGTEDGCTGWLWTAGRLSEDPPETGEGPPSPICTNGVTDLIGDSTEVGTIP